MLHKTVFVAAAALLLTLATSSEVQAWGCCHYGYHYGGYGGGYHAGYTHYGPVTGFQHVGTTGGYGYGGAYHYGSAYHAGGYGGYGGYHYGGYHYGGYPYGGYGAAGYRYGYNRAW
jgi:hypothetical protein